MENRQIYSHGLLYSVAPNSLASLHLNDEEGKDDFDWDAYEAQYRSDSFMEVAKRFLKTTAIHWGVIKAH
jgi:hypothetical protein